MNFSLEAKSRQVNKSSAITALKTQGQVPGVVYGLKGKPQALQVEYNDLLKILTQAGTSNIINLKVDDKNYQVIVREYQQDPVTDKLIHVDFLQVADDHPITTKVPLEFIGVSKAVKEQGGKLFVKEEKVKVKCLPVDLPASIKIDVTVLAELGQGILIKDLQVSDKVTILNNPTDPVVSVIVPKKIFEPTLEEVAPAEGEGVVEGEAPKEGGVKEEATPAEGETPKEGVEPEDKK